MAKTRDMTQGAPLKLLAAFALPMLLGNLFQQLYNMVDMMVVGRFVGYEALAAVGAAGSLDWLVLGIVTGMSQGFTILIAQHFGAKEMATVRKTSAMSIVLAALTALIGTALSLIVTVPLLRLMDTPVDIIGAAHDYLRIIFSGIPIIVAYNLFAAILRALGNSRSPLIALIIASLTNIVLDVVMVVQFDLGVKGVAYATVIAQSLACLYCLIVLLRLPMLRFERSDWRPDWKILGQLLKLGLPIAFQNGIIASGGIILQTIVNGFGKVFVAGAATAYKLCGLMEQAGVSFGQAVGVFTSQNLGAGKKERIREGVRSAHKLSLSVCAVISISMLIFGRQLVSLFVDGEPDIILQVVDVAYQYLCVMSVFMVALYLLFIYRAALQGMGDTFIPMMSGIVEMVMRIGMALLLPRFLGEFGVYIAEVSAWTGACILLAVVYYKRMRALLPPNIAQPT